MANASLRARTRALPHMLNARTEAVAKPLVPVLHLDLASLYWYPRLICQYSRLLSYVDIFLNYLLSLRQGPTHKHCNARWALFHAIYDVFRPLDDKDRDHQKEVLSLKKIDAEDFYWSNLQVLLGFIVNSINPTISLPPHRCDWLKEILDAIPHTQKRVSVDTWHQVLGEIRLMVISLPSAKCLFIQMQEALRHATGNSLTLTRGIHDALIDFHWLLDRVCSIRHCMIRVLFEDFLCSIYAVIILHNWGIF